MENLIKISLSIWNSSRKNIPLVYLDKKIQDIQGYEQIVSLLENWNFETPSICAILSNQNGIGKSHLASSTIRLFIKNYVKENYKKLNIEKAELPEFNLGFIPERVFLRELRDGYRDKYFSETEFYKSYCNYSMLVLDDIFSSKEKDQEFSRRAILDLLNDRFEYYKRPTVITSNLNLQEIADIDTRFASRINNSMLIEITSEQTDFRKKL